MKRTKEYVLNEYDRGKWPLVFKALKEVEYSPNVVYDVLEKAYGSSPEEKVRVIQAWSKINKILKRKAKSATAVAEFGAGWGGQLFNLWLNGGPDVLYYAFEYTDKGIECIEAICDMDPAFGCISFPFDFYAPETWDKAVEVLNREISPLIFTCYAIEQIPEISKEFFLKFAKEVPHGRYVHLEPVGWQMLGERNKYAEDNDYNRNLMDVLLELEDEKLIEIVSIKRDLISYNPHGNATSYIEWVPR